MSASIEVLETVRIADPRLDGIVHRVVAELTSQGAVAVALVGSRARGDAYQESDVDLRAVGEGPEYHLMRRGNFLLSLSWMTEASCRASFEQPETVGGFVPCWRGARILYDPGGIAASLQDTARAWTWDRLHQACDIWVAKQITGYAEEVHRLVGNYEMHRIWAAAFVRNVLALRMAVIMAVHRRILYDSENVLWDCVAQAMGDRWRDAQSQAFGVNGESMEETCRAALELYALAAAEVSHLLNEEQRAVVAYGCALAGYPLPRDAS